jgi:O-antigen/teichoic acid export membrane protein
MATPPRAEIRRNVLLNLLGHGLPLAAALVAVPLLLAALGPDRFAVVALALSIVAVVGVFDLGFGRAMTQSLAARIGQGRQRGAGGLVGSAVLMTAVLGALMAIALYLALPVIVFQILKVPQWLRFEALAGLRIVALAVPAVLVGNCLRGVVEARQRFGALTVLRTIIGIALLLGPLAVLRFSPTVLPIMWVFVGVRWIALVGFALLARRALPDGWSVQMREIAAMARLGGWMTVSTVAASIMLYADRFVVGALVSLEAVTYYAAPFEVIFRLSFLPAAVMGVLFPAFSQLVAARSHDLAAVYRRAVLAIGVLIAPAALVIAVFSRPLLSLWLGPEVAQRSAVVASILAVGMLVHSLVQPSFQLLQAAGRPAVPALFQTVELPVYVVYLVVMTMQWGIVGTAAAWLIRVTISLVVQTWLAHRFVLSPFAVERVGA